MSFSPAEILKKIRSLPEAIQDFIFNPEEVDKLEKIFLEEKLSERDGAAISGLISMVFLKEISLSDFLDLLKKDLPDVPQNVVKKIALKIAENRFLPLEDYLGGGVGDLIKNLGVDPKSIEVQRVEVKSLTAEEAAAEILLESGLKFEEPSLAKRTQEIIEMRLREVRDDLETVAALVRGTKIGGLGLDEEQAKKIVDAIKVKLFQVLIITEEQRNRETEKQKTEPLKPAEAVGPTSPVGPIGPIGPISPIYPEEGGVEEEPKPPEPAAKSPTPVSPINPIRPIGPISPISPISPAKEELKEPPRQGGVSAPLRKAAPPEKSVAKKAPEKRLDETGAPIKAEVYGAEEEREVGLIKKEMAKKMADFEIMTVEDAIKKIIKETGAESRGDDYVNKFRNILYARLRDIRDASETKEMLTKHPRLGGLGFAPDEAEKTLNLIEDTFKALHQKKTEEITLKLKEGQVKLRKEKEERQKSSKDKEEKALDDRWVGLTRKTAAADKKFKTVKIAPAAPPQAGEKMPKEMEDIKSKKVLTGPTEELGQLTLSDFRKLSQIAMERAKKIKEKIDLLAQEDITKKIAGITAWKKSEVMKVYFDILKESMLTGKTISQLIAEKTAQNQPVLAEDEFKAIVDLNGELKI